MPSPEPYTPEVSGFYGPGPIWAWRVAVLSTTLTNVIRMRLRKKVDTNILIAEAFTTISYPLIASFDLIFKISRHPYDWEAIRSIPPGNLYMVAAPVLYPSLGHAEWSLSSRSQAANVLLPLNIIDSFLPFPFLACITLLFSDSVMLSRSTKRNFSLLLSISFTWCLLVDMSFAAKMTGLHPTGEQYSGIILSFVLVGGRLMWASYLYLMPLSSLAPMLIMPVWYGLVSEYLSFLWALARCDDDMLTALGRHASRLRSHFFSAIHVWSIWSAIGVIFFPSAWVPEFPDFGLMLGDLDQAAALGVAVVLALYSLCETLRWKPWRRGDVHLDVNDIERNDEQGADSYSRGDGDSGSIYALESPNIGYRD